jgi:hypothetical protein
MSIPTAKIIDLQSNEIVERPLTEEELNVIASEKERHEQRILTEKQAKAAAEAKLAALGLTTDDLKALGLGGN